MNCTLHSQWRLKILKKGWVRTKNAQYHANQAKGYFRNLERLPEKEGFNKKYGTSISY